MAAFLTRNIKTFLPGFLFLTIIFSGHHALANTSSDIKEKMEACLGDENCSAVTISGASYSNETASFVAVDNGVAANASLDMTSSSLLHIYEIHGRSVGTNNSEAIVTIGYKKRY